MMSSEGAPRAKVIGEGSTRATITDTAASSSARGKPSGLAQVRAALPHLPERAWCVPLELEAGPPVDSDPATVEGSAETIEFDAVAIEPEPETTPEHAWGPRALAVRPAAPAPTAMQP